MVSPQVQGHLAQVLTILNFGGFQVLTKVALMEGVSQIVFCVYRDLIALCILGPIAYFTEKRVRTPIPSSLLLSFFFLGLTGVFGSQLLFLLGLLFTSPTAAAALQPSIPVFTAILAVIFGTESLNFNRLDGKVKVGGVLVVVAGACFMTVYKGPAILGDDSPSPELVGGLDSDVLGVRLDMWSIGVLCIIGHCMCLSTYFAYQAKVLKIYPHWLTVTACSSFFGACFMLLGGAFTISDVSAFRMNGLEIYAVIYAGVLASAVNYMLMSYSNKQLGPSLIGLYLALQPPVTSALAFVFLGTAVYLGSFLGGAIILVGLFCVVWSRKEAERFGGRAGVLLPGIVNGGPPASVKVPLLE